MIRGTLILIFFMLILFHSHSSSIYLQFPNYYPWVSNQKTCNCTAEMVKNWRLIFSGQKVQLIWTPRSDMSRGTLMLILYFFCVELPLLITAMVYGLGDSIGFLPIFIWNLNHSVTNAIWILHLKLILLCYSTKKNKQKKTKKKQNKIKKESSVKHLCQVASPGGRILSTEWCW